MNSKNLLMKFGLVLLLVVICLVGLKTKGLAQGIDLRGGHSLIYEIMTTASERKRLEAQKADLAKELAQPSLTEEARKDIQDKQGRVQGELDRLGQTNDTDLATRIINILKKRIDPNGLSAIEWRPLANNRIEVRMPIARKDTQDRKQAYFSAIEEIEKRNVQRSDLRRLPQLPQAQRQAKIDEIAKVDPEQAVRVTKLLAAATAMEAARTANNQDALDKANDDYEKLLDEIQKGNINVSILQTVLSNFVSPTDDTLRKSSEGKQRIAAYDKGLEELEKSHPARAKEVADVRALYEKWGTDRQYLDDPSDLKRMISKAGVLEFRIAPYNPDSAQQSPKITKAEQTQYQDSLRTEGAEAGRKANRPLVWFPIHGDREGYDGLVTGFDMAGRKYILLYNQPGWEMLREGMSGWTLTMAREGTDSHGLPAVHFGFNEAGAKKFSQLTGNHIGHCMAILLDDEVYSSPVINSRISSEGIIEGKFTQQEVKELSQILESGSLPARLNPKPVAENTFGPAIGEQNLRMALKAGMIGTILIVIFMLGYYMMAGMIANIALALNVLFILGAMSWMNAVFTLPGVAGLILSIGMAVDANVLIYERLREEQDKGLTVRQSLKAAYERAFSAIFDSNMTTLLTCLILGWVGSEEVRGFAITLGLGILFNLFTAVSVTRWLFQALLDSHIVQKPLTMLRLIHVPKIDWMSKRYYFWAFSLATGIFGIVAFASQGRDVMGIEFSAGTQMTIQLRDDALIDGKLPNDYLVAERFRDVAEKQNFVKLRDTANVEKRINPDQVANFLKDHDLGNKGFVTQDEWKKQKLSEQFFGFVDLNHDGKLDRTELEKLPTNMYQVSTTETNIETIRKAADLAFGDALQTRASIAFTLEKGTRQEQMGVDLAADGKTRITPALRRTAAGAYRDELLDYEDGAIFVIDVNKPTTTVDISQRIREMRFQPDFATQSLTRTSVLGLKAAGEDKYSSFAVLVQPSDSDQTKEAGAWGNFTGKELTLLQEALKREEATIATTFDPALAGEASNRALVAVILGWVGIIIYLWVRFGSWKWGLSAVVTVVHDVTIVVGLVAVSGWIKNNMPGVASALMIDAFKIDLAMIAALLTLIGYSVNDTIVVFDRIRENRGRLATISPSTINLSINQTLSRTLLTSSTVFIVVLVMYISGGPGIHAFNYAFLFGVLFGTYSSIAVSAPLLLGFKQLVGKRVMDSEAPSTTR